MVQRIQHLVTGKRAFHRLRNRGGGPGGGGGPPHAKNGSGSPDNGGPHGEALCGCLLTLSPPYFEEG
jgi:hypothetical protein